LTSLVGLGLSGKSIPISSAPTTKPVDFEDKPASEAIPPRPSIDSISSMRTLSRRTASSNLLGPNPDALVALISPREVSKEEADQVKATIIDAAVKEVQAPNISNAPSQTVELPKKEVSFPELTQDCIQALDALSKVLEDLRAAEFRPTVKFGQTYHFLDNSSSLISIF